MHTKNVRMRPVPLWGRCTGSTDFTSRKKNTRKTNGATKQHSMRDQRQLWKSFSSSFASFEFTPRMILFIITATRDMMMNSMDAGMPTFIMSQSSPLSKRNPLRGILTNVSFLMKNQ